MKKFLFSALMAVPFIINAQQVVTFEDLILPSDSYYEGADNAGSFTSNNVRFDNYYDTAYFMWSGGFAYSNMKNDSVGDYTNSFSAYPATGAENSEVYAVFTPGFGATQYIDFQGSTTITSLSITNTTYAYYSMKNGDVFAKKFGSTTDANGDDDGTNGKDYFYVTIYSHDASNEILDSVVVYLADFRSTDTLDHYILDTWEEVNINLTGNKLSFKLTSSDNGDYGMNTPAYFAFDNIKFGTVVSVKETTLPTISIYPNPAVNQLSVTNYNGTVKIFAANGSLVKSADLNGYSIIDVSDLNSGIYQLVTENGSVKFIKN